MDIIGISCGIVLNLWKGFMNILSHKAAMSIKSDYDLVLSVPCSTLSSVHKLRNIRVHLLRRSGGSTRHLIW